MKFQKDVIVYLKDVLPIGKDIYKIVSYDVKRQKYKAILLGKMYFSDEQFTWSYVKEIDFVKANEDDQSKYKELFKDAEHILNEENYSPLYTKAYAMFISYLNNIISEQEYNDFILFDSDAWTSLESDYINGRLD